MRRVVCFGSSSCNTSPSHRASVTSWLVVVLVVSAAMLLTQSGTGNAAPVAPSRNGRNGNGAAAGAAAAATPQPNGRHRPHRPGNGNGAVTHVYQIERPGECRQDAIYADCFLCGKVADDVRIYRGCCSRDAEIISFCRRLLE